MVKRLLLIVFIFWVAIQSTAQEKDSLLLAISKQLQATNYQSNDSINELVIIGLRDLDHVESDSIKAQFYHNLSVKEMGIRNDSLALFYQFKALEIHQKLNDSANALMGFMGVAKLFYLNNEKRKALIYMKKALDYNKRKGTTKTPMAIFNNIGSAYSDLGLLDSALYYHEIVYRGVDTTKSSKGDDRVGVYTYNYAKSLFENKFYNKSMHYANKVLKMLPFKRLKRLEYKTLLLQARILIAQEQLDYAEKYLLRADSALFRINQLVEEDRDFESQVSILQNLISIQLLKSGKQDYLKYLDRLVALNDTIIDFNNKNLLIELETKYNLKQKEQELILQKERSQNLLEKNERNKWITALSAGVAMTSMIIVGLLFYFRNQKQKLIEAKVKQKEVELEKIVSNHETELFKATQEGALLERNKISMELHDEVGAILTALKLQLESNNADLVKSKHLLKEGISTVRKLSYSLSDQKSAKLGLIDKVEFLQQSFSNTNGIEVEVFFENYEAGISEEIELETFKVIAELLNNSVKHAHCSLVEIELSVLDDKLVLLYNDNGIGFEVEKSKSGLGLMNIKTRVEELNGTLIIESAKGQGTSIIVKIPLNDKDNFS